MEDWKEFYRIEAACIHTKENKLMLQWPYGIVMSTYENEFELMLRAYTLKLLLEAMLQ